MGVLEGTIVEPPETLRIKKTDGTEEQAPNPLNITPGSLKTSNWLLIF
jgi:hypothetical protein